MWYRSQKGDQKNKSPKPMGFEEKILRADAENAIRRKLRLKGHDAPSRDEIARYVERTIEGLKKHYGSLNNVRITMPGESLTPAVEKILSEILPKRK